MLLKLYSLTVVLVLFLIAVIFNKALLEESALEMEYFCQLRKL